MLKKIINHTSFRSINPKKKTILVLVFHDEVLEI